MPTRYGIAESGPIDPELSSEILNALASGDPKSCFDHKFWRELLSVRGPLVNPLFSIGCPSTISRFVIAVGINSV